MADNRADKIDELIDLYDKNGKKLGLTTQRGNALQQGQYRLVTCVLVLNQKNEVVVQQRSFNKIGNPGGFEAIVSGTVLAGENSLQAAHREIKEELGLQIEVPEKNFSRRFTNRQVLFDYYFAKSNFDENNIEFQKSEIEKIEVANFDRTMELLNSNHYHDPYEEFFSDLYEEAVKNA